MRISVLGCGGSRAIGSKTTAFLIDKKLLLDAGTVTEVLTAEECADIDNVFITHAHIDHIGDLPFFIEAVFDFRKRPVVLYGMKEVVDDISSHILNGRIWPDFSKIPNSKEARLYYKTLDPLKPIEAGSYSVLPIPVNHTVPTAGYLVNDGKTAFAFTSDTYITDKFWEIIRKEDLLRVLVIEASFPNRMEGLAKATGHLTPKLAAEELTKLNRKDVEIFVSHIKPSYKEEVVSEIKKLSERLPIEVLEDGMEISL